jgi:AAA+ superfamily predicted ATPase
VIRDAHLGLRDQPLAVARLKALVTKVMASHEMLLTVFLVSSEKYIPPELEKFITVFDIPPPNEAEIRQIISNYAKAYEISVQPQIVGQLALAFQGLEHHEIIQLLNLGYQQDGQIDLDDLALVHAAKAQIIQKSGFLEMIQNQERLDHVGGLAKLKPWLTQKAKIFSDWPRARDFGVESPKGVMLVGMPGCGKSLAAKATASLFGLPLLKMDMGSLMGKYVGESEGNMRRAIQVAEAVSPCVLWVDEVEKAFVGTRGQSRGSEVSIRMFGYFLTWMQEKTKQVFVVATANDISVLPPELLRKGRFDEIFYIDLPNFTERTDILKVHLQKRGKFTPNLDLTKLTQNTDRFSGADLESVVKEAIELAFINGQTPLTTELLLQVVKSTDPLSSVMQAQMQEFQDKFKKMKIKPAS